MNKDILSRQISLSWLCLWFWIYFKTKWLQTADFHASQRWSSLDRINHHIWKRKKKTWTKYMKQSRPRALAMNDSESYVVPSLLPRENVQAGAQGGPIQGDPMFSLRKGRKQGVRKNDISWSSQDRLQRRETVHIGNSRGLQKIPLHKDRHM